MGLAFTNGCTWKRQKGEMVAAVVYYKQSRDQSHRELDLRIESSTSTPITTSPVPDHLVKSLRDWNHGKFSSTILSDTC